MRRSIFWTFCGVFLTLGFITFGTFYSPSVVSQYRPVNGEMSPHLRRTVKEKALNDKTRIYFFFGTRPEVIKMAPVIKTFTKSEHFTVTTVYTGQHPDLIHPFLKLFNITVDIWFDNVVLRNQSITYLIEKIMLLAEEIVSKPSDTWMVQGDTSTAFAIATVAFHRGLRIAHIEAGLRTFNMYSPFPEEFNRKTISSIATFHFAPTQNNKEILLKEGIPEEHIFVTGNTVIDAVKYLQTQNKTKMPDSLSNVTIEARTLVLITLHRRENLNVMSKLYGSIKAVQCPNCLFVVPVHPNPNAGKAARNICKIDTKRFICIPPLSYEEVHWVMSRAQFILTDSGGLQEEATWYHVPALVLRENTERMEAVTAGVAALVGSNLKLLQEKMASLIDSSSDLYKSMSKQSFPFGDGTASEQIFKILVLKEKYPPKQITLQIKEKNHENLRTKDFQPVNIGVVLQVFKRNSLQLQLEAALNQTLVPRSLIVLQNGYHVDVSKTIADFRAAHPGFTVQHIAASKNLRFHGRFYIAYMMRETYVSVWDDDIIPQREWLQYCVEYSKAHGNALVGANARTILEVYPKKRSHREEFVGKNDLAGHTWTLPREFLKFYLEMEMPTLYTGEDILLSYALQKQNINTMVPEQHGDKAAINIRKFGNDAKASFRTNQSPRHYLFCKLLKEGFKPIKCKNCKNTRILDACMKHFGKEAKTVEWRAEIEDRNENNQVVWTVPEMEN